MNEVAELIELPPVGFEALAPEQQLAYAHEVARREGRAADSITQEELIAAFDAEAREYEESAAFAAAMDAFETWSDP